MSEFICMFWFYGENTPTTYLHLMQRMMSQDRHSTTRGQKNTIVNEAAKTTPSLLNKTGKYNTNSFLV